MPESLKGAASFAWDLAQDHPDDFGFPWADPGTHVLELRVTGDRGEAIARDWLAGRLGRRQKFTDLSPTPEVRLIRADRSFRQLTDIQHGVTFLKDIPGYDVMYETGPDARRNATVITIQRLSDPLLRALAERYGTAAVVIRVDPARPTFLH